MRKLLKSVKFWIIAVASVIVIAGAGVGIPMLVNLWTPISTPKNLCVVSTSKATYVMVDDTKNAEKYEFVFSASGQDNIVLTSPSNVLDVSSLLDGYCNYQIKARAIAKAGYGDSEFTKNISYNSKIKIPKPTLTLDEENNRLYVALHESYTFEVNFTVELYYNGVVGGEALKLTSINQPAISDNQHGEYLNFFDLSVLGDGEFQLGVIIIPDDTEHFEKSDLTLL
ncbi:MAG: hypothetical protein IKT27_00760 [Clostridia bacterium]|nr:hypothetical protein [Clostridia bacterium]